MGIFSEIKKLFFVTQSVGKSAADKGYAMAKNASGEIVDKASDIVHDIADTASSKATTIGEGLGETLASKTEGLRDAILHSAEGTMNMVNKSETLKNVASTTERLGEKVLSTGEDMIHKGGEAVEALGSKILGSNHENLEKAKDLTEKVGSKVLKTIDIIADKAKDLMEDINEKIDETIEKAKNEAEAEAAAPPPEPFHEKIRNEKEDSLLDGSDDFFAKAEKFANGDYSGVQEGMITIDDTTHEVDKVIAKAGGFVDHDGDGNELVDDAMVVIEDQKEAMLSEMGGMMDEASDFIAQEGTPQNPQSEGDASLPNINNPQSEEMTHQQLVGDKLVRDQLTSDNASSMDDTSSFHDGDIQQGVNSDTTEDIDQHTKDSDMDILKNKKS